MKFLHTLGAAGLMGGMAVLAVMALRAPAAAGTAGYAPLMGSMAAVAAWIIGPCMVLTVVAGLLSIAVHSPFQEAGWVWAKAATGILIFEGGLHVMGPLQEEAKRTAAAHAAGSDPAGVATLLAGEINTLWLLLAVSVANVALGVWRPRLPSINV